MPFIQNHEKLRLASGVYYLSCPMPHVFMRACYARYLTYGLPLVLRTKYKDSFSCAAPNLLLLPMKFHLLPHLYLQLSNAVSSS
jgi:hypothetical protein